MKIGDKVRIIDEEHHAFKIGDEGVILNIYYHDEYTSCNIGKVKGKNFPQSLKDHQFELILETHSYYSFFRFLHPNMEESNCKELFDKIIKEYESSDSIK